MDETYECPKCGRFFCEEIICPYCLDVICRDASSKPVIDQQAERIKELEANLKEFGNHKRNCAYVQGLRGQSIEKCDCGFE